MKTKAILLENYVEKGTFENLTRNFCEETKSKLTITVKNDILNATDSLKKEKN